MESGFPTRISGRMTRSFAQMDFKATSTKRSKRNQLGFTLVELMWAIAISGIIVAAVCSAIMFSGRSFQGLNNYVDLDNNSRRSLDIMMTDIRSALKVTGYATNQLKITGSDGAAVTFDFNSAKRSLSRIRSGKTNILLRECDKLEFSMYRRTPTSTGGWGQTNDVAYCKLVQVNWTCSRGLYPLGAKWNTESVQTAKIVIRNEPAL
jgi:prepilin-type N-terminal cleavage/methylation domain-containing protein